MKYILLCLMLVSVAVSAKIYKWTDANGKHHYADKPPIEQTSDEINEEELGRKISSFTQVSVEITPFDFGLNAQSNMVIMYSTKWCPYCAKARKYFAENNIDYIEKRYRVIN